MSDREPGCICGERSRPCPIHYGHDPDVAGSGGARGAEHGEPTSPDVTASGGNASSAAPAPSPPLSAAGERADDVLEEVVEYAARRASYGVTDTRTNEQFRVVDAAVRALVAEREEVSHELDRMEREEMRTLDACRDVGWIPLVGNGALATRIRAAKQEAEALRAALRECEAAEFLVRNTGVQDHGAYQVRVWRTDWQRVEAAAAAARRVLAEEEGSRG